MLGSYGIQPVTLVFNNFKNCFLHLSPNLVSQLCLRENQVLELSWIDGDKSLFLSWIKGSDTLSSGQEDRIGLSRQLGEKLGLSEGTQGFLRPCVQVQSVQQVFVEPLSSDDWEILELHCLALEQQLLDQIRVVFRDAVFPVWVDQHTVIYIRIVSFSPSVSFGRLEQFTELVVTPKVRSGSKQIPYVPKDSEAKNQRQQNTELTSTSITSSTGTHESLTNQPDYSRSHRGAMADLRSLLRYMFTGKYDPAKEIHDVPTIPVVFQDCILRVCGSPPAAISHLGSRHGDIHVFPWYQSDCCSTGQPVLTYGRLSKIYSPKEVRKQAKQAMEKKKSSDSQTDSDLQEPTEESVVVKMICHNVENLDLEHRSCKLGDIYGGKIWIPGRLRDRLSIDTHSAVKVCPLRCSPKIAVAVLLQPVNSLAETESEEDVQSSFLNWLHALSHQPLACLTARTDLIILQCTEGKSEFILTVLKPEAEPKQVDEIFLLSTGALHKADIQIIKEPHLSRDTSAHPAEKSPCAGFPSLSALGGVKEISTQAFEHISHSLMGGPLSCELISTSCGLRSGALLIMGAKGSGKTSLAKALCLKAVEELDAHIEVLDTKKLKGKRADTVRQRLEELFEQAVWRQPSVVLLDDLDHMTGAATTPEQEQGAEAVLQHHIAQSLKDLVDEVVGRSSLVTLLVTAQNEHTLHPLLTEVQGSHFFQSFCKIEAPDQGFTPPSLWGVRLQVPGVSGMEQVGGLHQARQLLLDTILLPAKPGMLQYPRLFSSLPIRHRSGLLLYGAPGTGKTLLAGAVAKESGMNFISIKGPELLSKYIGASEQAVRDVFQRAQAAKPCILFFDEFDSLAPRRGHDSTGVTDRVVNQLLTQLDGVEGLQGVYVLAATSRPDLIDPALLRPGRLDKTLYCPPPDRQARLEILKALTRTVPLAADVDLEQIAVATEQYTGADLKGLLYNAQLEAIHSSLGPNVLADLGSGSDSEVSVSSLIFLNHSSGSDDSAGETEAGMETSSVALEHSEIPTEELNHNIWRLYFGSSFDLELGHRSPSELNSQCISVPNSTTHELTGASVRDVTYLRGPVLMSSVQQGFQELNSEQSERLRADLSIIKSSYNKSSEDTSLGQTGPIKPAVLICQSHLMSALDNTRASISKQDWRRYTDLFETFGALRQGKTKSAVLFTPGQRVTLA
ncbi:Peroxisome biogenesis factor 1 [Bagarius yarrelli]|uniref:Peroxisomal ATPase PEX1 n=1 Tax=Bagarius yarrelli TaxID=175774 RepID=A0A556TPL9_BAGYA|nr:Peroxisome biogenesis factor 1 [Bagarius yarrelli]